MTTLQEALNHLAGRGGAEITTMNAGADRLVIEIPAEATVCWLAEAGASVDQTDMGDTERFEVTPGAFRLAPHEGDRLLEAAARLSSAAGDDATLHIGVWTAGEGEPVEIGIAAL